MKTRLRNTCPSRNCFKMLYYSTPHKILSGVICEDQIEGIVPEFAGLFLFRLLLLLLSLQCVYHDRSRQNRPGLPALGSQQEVLPVLPLKLLLDRNRSSFEVHSVPGNGNISSAVP